MKCERCPREIEESAGFYVVDPDAPIAAVFTCQFCVRKTDHVLDGTPQEMKALSGEELARLLKADVPVRALGETDDEFKKRISKNVKLPPPTGTPDALAGAIDLMSELEHWRAKFEELRRQAHSRGPIYAVPDGDGGLELFERESDAQTYLPIDGPEPIPFYLVSIEAIDEVPE